jgi:hypothetical protein
MAVFRSSDSDSLLILTFVNSKFKILNSKLWTKDFLSLMLILHTPDLRSDNSDSDSVDSEYGNQTKPGQHKHEHIIHTEHKQPNMWASRVAKSLASPSVQKAWSQFPTRRVAVSRGRQFSISPVAKLEQSGTELAVPKAAALIIGNEVLSGKIQDVNVASLGKGSMRRDDIHP